MNTFLRWSARVGSAYWLYLLGTMPLSIRTVKIYHDGTPSHYMVERHSISSLLFGPVTTAYPIDQDLRTVRDVDTYVWVHSLPPLWHWIFCDYRANHAKHVDRE